MVDHRNSPFIYDILLNILTLLEFDCDALYQCSLVNHHFNNVASRLLYSHVVFSPRPHIILREKNDFVSAGMISSLLPKNADYVLHFEISGLISLRPPSLNRLGAKLSTAIRAFHNLNTVTLLPKSERQQLFTDVVPALKECRYLRNLAVNDLCADEAKAPILATIDGLQKLTLSDPTRAILNVLPEWLSRLSKSLKELHLKDNCGSVTPGVLRSFLPHLSEIRAFSLGLSYSLTDGDIFSFLSQLPELEVVELQYYLQLKTFENPPLPNLRSFTVIYPPDPDADRFCEWIISAVCSSPLEALRLHRKSYSNTPISGDNVASYLADNKFSTIRILDLRWEVLSIEILKRLCETCLEVEELLVTVSHDTALRSFGELASRMKKLHTVHFEVLNITGPICTSDATSIMTEMHSLRRLWINDDCWEGAWESNETGLQFLVQEATTMKTPWRRITEA